MTSVTVLPADQIAGLLNITQAQAQKIVDLEICYGCKVAALRRLLAEARPVPPIHSER